MYTIWEAYPWVFGEPFCIFKTFLSEMTSSASVLTITAFTAERYVAICHPIRSQTMSSLSRAVKIIIGIWVMACLTALPYPAHTRTFYYLEHPVTGKPIADSYQCNILPKWGHIMKYMFQISTFILFLVPMAVITVLYVLIGLTLRRSSIARRTSDKVTSSPTGPSQPRKTVLKMLGKCPADTSVYNTVNCRKACVFHLFALLFLQMVVFFCTNVVISSRTI